jgi:hypothetical protein
MLFGGCSEALEPVARDSIFVGGSRHVEFSSRFSMRALDFETDSSSESRALTRGPRAPGGDASPQRIAGADP